MMLNLDMKLIFKQFLVLYIPALICFAALQFAFQKSNTLFIESITQIDYERCNNLPNDKLKNNCLKKEAALEAALDSDVYREMMTASLSNHFFLFIDSDIAIKSDQANWDFILLANKEFDFENKLQKSITEIKSLTKQGLEQLYLLMLIAFNPFVPFILVILSNLLNKLLKEKFPTLFN